MKGRSANRKKGGYLPAGGSDFTIRRYLARSEVPEAAAQAMLIEHLTLMRQRMIGSDGPEFEIDAHRRAFWEGFERFLPPSGSYYLAFDATGRVVGTAAMQRIPGDIGEMKHLYVRPEMRGLGLGRALVEARLADASAMGLTSVRSDTFDVNHEMRGLYRSLGFVEVPPFADSTTSRLSPELVSRMVFCSRAI